MARVDVVLDESHISVLRSAASSKDGTVFYSEDFSGVIDYLVLVSYIKNLGGGIYKITPSGIKTFETSEMNRIMDVDGWIIN